MYKIQLRRDVSTDWLEKEPILGAGEPGVETDTGRFKIGDGLSTWSSLPYFVPGNAEEVFADLEEHINSLTPHIVYDAGPSLELLYQNAKV